VQEAMIDLYCQNWTKDDRIYMFLTPEAEINNWEGSFYDGNGLKNILLKFKHLTIEAVTGIPSGMDEQEIWKLFEILFEKIEPEREIYLDITHSFRSLPMLQMVLLDYAKALKGCKVANISYGAFEVLGPAYEIEKKYPNPHDRNAPVLNLTSFSTLQDWTQAASEFIKLGKADNLANLVEDSQPKLAQHLIQLEQSIATCRGKLLTQDLDITELKNTLLFIKDVPIKEQLKPLISKIENKIEGFENGNTLKNGFSAVDWCIQHNMIQQGITFLQETLITHIVEEIVGKDMINDLFYREIAATSLMLLSAKGNRFFEGKFTQRPEDQQQLILDQFNLMRDYVKANAPLKDIYSELIGSEGFRNDINHCGFRANYHSSDELRESLKNLFQKIRDLNLT